MSETNPKHPKLSRLSLRIVLCVFLSVVVIEAVILIPSYRHRQTELLDHLRELAKAQVTLFTQMEPQWTVQDPVQNLTPLLKLPSIKGGSIYTRQGRKVGSFGEEPTLTFQPKATLRQSSAFHEEENRYDILCPASNLGGRYVLVLRQDASLVEHELRGYVLRIAGLVVIISLFVTAGAWLALGPLVITPILRLRSNLVDAGNTIAMDQPVPHFYAESVRRRDELGEVITAFRGMLEKITDAISRRKQAEAQLQTSYRQVEDYSQALKSELSKGRKMQKNFLPARLPKIPGWQIAAFFRAARQVAGDFYDVFKLPDKRLGIVVADVCDKGVGAALFMALFRSLIRIFSGQTSFKGFECLATLPEVLNGSGASDDLAEVPLRAVNLTNDYIAQNHGDLAMFATLFFGVLDTMTGRLAYVNGGHDPLLLITSDGGIKKELVHTGPAVGIATGMGFKVKEVQLEKGDLLLGYTDGVSEASNAQGEFFTLDRLMGIIQQSPASAQVLIERIRDAVLAHTGASELFDDITVLALGRKG